MTLRASARCCPRNSADDRALAAVRRCPRRAPHRTAVKGERGEISPDARRMNTSVVACYEFAAPTLRRPARKVTSQSLFTASAVIGLVIGCGWTVYANIFAAGPYPELGSTSFDAPVARRFVDFSVHSVARIEPPTIEAPEAVAAEPALSFLDRFAAASPQGVA